MRQIIPIAALALLGGCAFFSDVLRGIGDVFEDAPSAYLARSIQSDEGRPHIFTIERLRIAAGRIPEGDTTSYEAINNRIYVQLTDLPLAPFGIADFSVRGDGAYAVAVIEEDIDAFPRGPEEIFAVFVSLPEGRSRSRVTDNVIAEGVARRCFDDAAGPILAQELPEFAADGTFDPDQPYDVSWGPTDTSGVGAFPFRFQRWTSTGDAAFEIFLLPEARVTQNGQPVRNGITGRDVFTLFETSIAFTLSPETTAVTTCTSGTAAAPPLPGPYAVVPVAASGVTIFNVERTGDAPAPLLSFPASDLTSDRFAVSGPVRVSRVIE